MRWYHTVHGIKTRRQRHGHDNHRRTAALGQTFIETAEHDKTRVAKDRQADDKTRQAHSKRGTSFTNLLQDIVSHDPRAAGIFQHDAQCRAEDDDKTKRLHDIAKTVLCNTYHIVQGKTYAQADYQAGDKKGEKGMHLVTGR